MKKRELALAKNLNKLVKEKNITMSSLAYRAGISKSSLHSYFVGVEPKTVIALKKVAEQFGISLDELVFVDDSVKEPDKMEPLRFEVIIRPLEDR